MYLLGGEEAYRRMGTLQQQNSHSLLLLCECLPYGHVTKNSSFFGSLSQGLTEDNFFDK